MPRPAGSLNKSTREFVAQYERLVMETNVNPVEVLFKLCKSKSPAIRRAAASDLLPYRYPKMAAEQPEIETQNEFSFSWDEVVDANDLPESETAH